MLNILTCSQMNYINKILDIGFNFNSTDLSGTRFFTSSEINDNYFKSMQVSNYVL
jgi:hypothetical protein